MISLTLPGWLGGVWWGRWRCGVAWRGLVGSLALRGGLEGSGGVGGVAGWFGGVWGGRWRCRVASRGLAGSVTLRGGFEGSRDVSNVAGRLRRVRLPRRRGRGDVGLVIR
jgi:hypothetical protein